MGATHIGSGNRDVVLLFKRPQNFTKLLFFLPSSCYDFILMVYGDPNLRVAERPTTSSNVPVCLALKKKVRFARKGSSRRITEQFREASSYRPMIQNAKMLKAKAKR
ncbi:hypothetical protein MTR67_012935 [Solanum verrucosum]|uniref:Uncharacterized protein n=1 Tax=Solanum verrucosum TaxID=315347 RepID=A0AAF0QC77_SOLVR|nr:hypothetical protein MTR67_012935 [Solanum verrucosum]